MDTDSVVICFETDDLVKKPNKLTRKTKQVWFQEFRLLG